MNNFLVSVMSTMKDSDLEYYKKIHTKELKRYVRNAERSREILEAIDAEVEKRNEECSKCGHLKRWHVVHANWFGGRHNVYACSANMGQGDPCGCGEYDE